MKRILALLASAALVLAGTACSNDDNDEDNGGTPENTDSATAPTITWDSNPDFEPLELAESDNDITISVSAPEGIETLTVNVNSTFILLAMTLKGLSNPLDFIANAETISNVEELGLEVGDLYHATEATFSLATLAGYIYSMADAGTTHTFTVDVTDQKNQSTEKTITLVKPAGDEE